MLVQGHVHVSEAHPHPEVLDPWASIDHSPSILAGHTHSLTHTHTFLHSHSRLDLSAQCLPLSQLPTNYHYYPFPTSRTSTLRNLSVSHTNTYYFFTHTTSTAHTPLLPSASVSASPTPILHHNRLSHLPLYTFPHPLSPSTPSLLTLFSSTSPHFQSHSRPPPAVRTVRTIQYAASCQLFTPLSGPNLNLNFNFSDVYHRRIIHTSIHHSSVNKLQRQFLVRI